MLDVRRHWTEWRAGFEERRNVSEIHMLRTISELQGAFQHRVTLLDQAFRELIGVQHSDYKLTLANSLVEKHGGTIEAHSAGLGMGSEFVVRLPLARETQMVERPPARRPSPTRPPQIRRRVLVIDDSVPTAQSMARVLELWNHEVRICYDAVSALKVAQEFQPEVVLSDISLPQMDGYELARQLRQLPGMDKSLLIAITGHGHDDDRQRSSEAGFDQHLLKPVSPDVLAEIMSA